MKYLRNLFGAGLLALASVLYSYHSAHAAGTILTAVSEDVDWLSLTGSFTNTTAAGNYRATYARQAINITGGTADPPANYFLSQVFANQTTIWVHYQYMNGVAGSATPNTTANSQHLCVFASDGNPAVCIRGTGTTGQVKIESRNTSGTFTTLVTCPSSTWPSSGVSTLDQIDFKLTYAVSGEATIYKNSASICTFSGDTTTNSRTAVNQVRFSGGLNNNATALSEFIVSDQDTRALSVLDMFTSGNGNSVAWTGTNICSAIWNATAGNDASFGSSSTNNQIHQCTVNNTFPSGTFNVAATVQSARALRGATGPQHFDFNTRTGAADFNSADQNPTTSFTNFQFIQATNPQTTNPWATTDLTAAGYNIGLKSTP